jgi:glycosyltransferase involved in cell wall biosynthesis
LSTAAFHQFLPTFAGGDAIGNHVLQLQRVLRDAGYQSDIYAEAIQPAVKKHGRHYTEWADAQPPGTWLLYHLSTGSPMGPWIAEQAERLPLAVYYHNITPARFFTRWLPEATKGVQAARDQLRRLAGPTRVAMANSNYSAQELTAEGYSDVHVVPVLCDLAAAGSRPDPKAMARLAGTGARWLFVGRLVPNKCQHDVIGAFAVYRRLFDPAARLSLVGGQTSELYHRALELLAAELGVADAVDFADHVSFPELVAHYRSASVFVSMSQHEGFCVPLLEAMQFGVPVVALRSSAVPETVGDAGLLVDEPDPLLVAAAVDRVLTDTGLAGQLTAAGHDRLEHYALAESGRKALEVLEKAAAHA